MQKAAVSRFFFHLHECGTVVADEEGVDLASLAEAQANAVKEAREVMSHEVRGGRLCLSCCIVIEDAHGDEVARVPFREMLTLTGI